MGLKKIGQKVYSQAVVTTGLLMITGTSYGATTNGFSTGENLTKSTVTLNDVNKNVSGMAENVTNTLFIIAVLIGIGFMISGIWGLTKGKQESQQEGMGKPFKHILAGVALCTIGIFIKVIASSLFVAA